MPGSRGAFCARPLARANTQSLVLMSPSTVRLLKLRGIAASSTASRCCGPMAASVTSTASTVASSGAIIPEPLQRMDRVTSRSAPSGPGSERVRVAIFTRVSSVRMASAACSASGLRLATASGRVARILCTGSRWPMTPVDAVSTAPTGMRSSAATASHTALTSARPAGPVSAFALPLLTSTAWMPPAGSRPCASSTGAALARFWVKTPAAEHGASLTMSATSLRLGLMPACRPANLNPSGTFTGGVPSGPRGPRPRASPSSD